MTLDSSIHLYPISETQKQFWVLSQLEPENMAYNIPLVYRTSQKVDKQSFANALSKTILKHPQLRSRIVLQNNEPYFEVYDKADIDVILKYSSFDKAYNEKQIQPFIDNEVNTPFKITNEVLFRCHFVECSDITVIIFVFHHIIIDLRSKNIFIDDLTSFYNDPSLPIEKSDKSSKDINYYSRFFPPNEYTEKMVKSWKKVLENLPNKIELPSIKNQHNKLIQNNLKHFKLSENLSEQIREYSKEHNITPFVFLLAAYLFLISRISNQYILSAGIPFPNRRKDEQQNIFGCYINILPLFIDFKNTNTITDLMAYIRMQLLQMHRRQEVPFIKLKELNRGNASESLFNIGFTQENTPIPELDDIAFTPVHTQRKGAQLDLFLTVNLEDSAIGGILEFSENLYDQKGAQKIIDLFTSTCQNFLSSNDSKLSDIGILTSEDKKFITDINSTDCHYNNEICLHELFENQVTKSPHAVALLDDTREITYRETNIHANNLSNHLISKGVKAGDIVAISCERSIEMMIGILAIHKAGAAYLPIQIDAPLERNLDIIENASPKLILTTTNGCKNLPDQKDQLVFINNIINSPYSDSNENPSVKVQPSDLAYIIYTSGSTGKPKGTLIEHHSVLNRIGWMQKHYSIDESDTLIQKTPYTFDVSVWELFWWFFNGSSLGLPKPNAEKDPYALIDFIETKKITKIHFVPSMFSAFLLALNSEEKVKKLKSLKTIFFSGESLKAPALEKFIAITGKNNCPELVNLYGPTEATVDVSFFNCPINLTSTTKIYIGKPIDNTGLYIVDKDLNIQPTGIPGELIITGVNLSRGYLNNNELTKKVFVDFIDIRGNKVKAYKTGDLAILDPSAEIEYIGRTDSQIKIRGMRVELGEIENVIGLHPEVANNAVLVYSEGATKRLISYIETKDKSIISKETILDYLTQKLPAHMVPAQFVFLENLPLTTSGKINRKALPEPDIKISEKISEQEYIGTIDQKTIKIWEECLGVNQISVSQNFFDIGGNSLLAIEITAKIRDAFNIEISPLSILEYPTLKSYLDFLNSFLQSNTKDSQTISTQKPSLSSKSEQDFKVLKYPTTSKDKENNNSSAKVAVVGMSCRYPGADNLNEFWQNLLNNEESIKRFSDEELADKEINYNELKLDPNFVAARGIINDVDKFDAGFFGYTPKEAANTDPQHRLWLESVWNVFEDAGCDPYNFDGRISVFCGGYINSYLLNNILRDPEKLENYIRLRGSESFKLLTGNEISYLPTKTAYKFNLRGPAINVQTACSTSLVAISQACQSLIDYKADAAIAGGVCIVVPQETGYIAQEGHIPSADGVCRPFDAKGNGTIFSNGVGVVFLKRLEDAIADRDQIYGVVNGWGLNNDGDNKVSYTAPSVEGQSEAILAAQENAQIEAHQLGYIEAHGTATPLGDPIEVKALTKAFNFSGATEAQFCGLGSVKGNIGHTDAAAGVASFIKVCLAARNKIIPATLHYHEANSQIDFKNSPFYVVDKNKVWNSDKKLIMGVSSFGIGGTNAHIIVEEPPVREGKVTTSQNNKYFLPVSAKTRPALERNIQRLKEFIRTNQTTDLDDLAFTLWKGRYHMRYRSMAVVESVNELLLDSELIDRYKCSQVPLKIAYAFPGQGAQFYKMGALLYKENKTFKHYMDKGAKIARSLLDIDLISLLYNWDNKQEAIALLSQTSYTQPALFLTEYALAKALQEINITPRYMIGHSIGEYTAACLAGVFSFEDAIKMVVKRGELMQKMPKGNMMVVKDSKENLQGLNLNLFEIAAVNSPVNCTISYSLENEVPIKEALDKLDIPYIKINTSHAFHSRSFDPILKEFSDFVSGFKMSTPSIPFISCLTGKFISDQEATTGKYWADQLRNTVNFSDGVKEIAMNDEVLIIEIGPNTHLSSIIKSINDLEYKTNILTTLGKENQEPDNLMERILCGIWCHNPDFKLDLNFIDEKATKISLPGYAFEKERHWIDYLASRNKSDITNIKYITDEESGENVDGNLKIEITQLLAELSGYSVKQLIEDKNFNEFGFDSLLIAQLARKIENKYKIKIEFRTIAHDLNKISLLSEYIYSRKKSKTLEKGKIAPKELRNFVKIRESGKNIPLAIVHGDDADKFLPKALGVEQPYYGYLHLGSDGEKFPFNSLQDISDAYYNELIQNLPQGPYILGGFSFGGNIAFNIAVRLQNSGNQVPLLILFDCMFPGIKDPYYWHKSIYRIIRSNLLSPIYPFIKERIEMILCGCLEIINSTIPVWLRKNYIIRAYSKMLKKHKQPPLKFNGEVLLFRARENKSAHEFLGWDRVAENITLIKINGDHSNIFKRNDNTDIIINSIKKSLKRHNHGK